MPSQTKQISLNAKWGMAQTVISACVLFFLYKYLLRELGAAKLGLWSLILASTSIAKLGELGFANATLRFVGKYIGADKPNEASEILETALLSISLPFLLLALVAIPLINVILPLFVPAQHMADALVIVPWAMLALWLGITGGLVQSAIDGCGRMDQRNMVLIATNLLYLASAVLLAPRLGLKGVAIAQAIQTGVTLALMWWLAKVQLKPLPFVPWRWRKARFFEIASFALTMQAGSIAGMFVEPVTKALISRFAGLEFLAYYDMANQVITRARSVLVSGFQAITPQFAITSDLATHRALFLQSQRKVIDMGIPFMTLVMIGFPLLSDLWVGHSELAFIASGQIIGLTWLLVTLMMPAYFFLTGTGRGLPVAVAQVITLIGTFGFGWIGGQVESQIGPILGATVALLVGNIYLYFIAVSTLFERNANNEMPRWIGESMLMNTAICLSAIGLNLLATKYADHLWEKIVALVVIATAVAAFALNKSKKTIQA